MPDDVGAMTVDELKAEVWYWREAALDKIVDLLGSVETAGQNGAEDAVARARSSLNVWACLLEDALEGCGPAKCEICDAPLILGQPVLRAVDMGEVHAECLGEAIGDGPVKPGDLVQLDPEGVVDEHDDPVPNSDGRLRCWARTPMRAVEEVEGLLQWARREVSGSSAA